MAGTSPGLALRQLEQAQAAMRKARQLVQNAREGGREPDRVIPMAWECLQATHKLLASIPLEAADEKVMLRQVHVQRYATALLVRLRRLVREEPASGDDLDDAFDDE